MSSKENQEPPDRQTWSEIAASTPGNDPLLAALVMVAGHYGKPTTPEALTASLPLDENRIGPANFIRAATRVGLLCRVIRKRPSRLSPRLLPAIVLLKDGGACVLSGLDRRNSQAVVAHAETGGLPLDISTDELERNATGYCILVRPGESRDPLQSDTRDPLKKNWLSRSVRHYWPIYAHVAALGLMTNILGVTLPLFTMNVYDRVLPNPQGAVYTLWVLAIGAVIAFSFDFVMRLLRAWLLDLAGRRIDVLLSSRLFAHMLDMRLEHCPPSSGRFAHELREFESVRDFFASASLSAFVDLPFLLVFILVLMAIAGPLGVVPLVAVPVVLIVSLLHQWPLKYIARKSMIESTRKHGVLVEAINALETVKALGAQGRMQAQWEEAVSAAAEYNSRIRFFSGIPAHFMVLVQSCTGIITLIYGTYLISDGLITSGALIAAVMLGSRALAPLGQIAGILSRGSQAMAAKKVLDDIISRPVEHDPGRHYLHRPIRNGKIVFEKASFQYANTDKPVLDELSFTIGAGERVGIIGKVGCGKTTLSRLVAQIYQPTSGHILIDDIESRQIDPADLRRGIGFVPQEVRLFSGTVRNNITVRNPSADDAAILEAAYIAGVDNFVRLNSLGYDLPVGEGGHTLSGGQRQSIAIARALIGEPPILVLDEPSSAMDHTSEATFIERLRPFLAGKTVLLNTHRSSMLALVDRVIVIDSGKIIADGPKDRILSALRDGTLRTRG